MLSVFNTYPSGVRGRLKRVRSLILETASRTQHIGTLDETLKWGQPSYLCKSGSTIRLGWNKANAEKYALYFHCGTSLVETFRAMYSNELQFEGNRAIVLDKHDRFPVEPLRHCIALALTYHRRKHLPMLGA